MPNLTIERIGGLAGFGGKNAHLQSRGEIDTENLSDDDKKTIEDLFRSSGTPGESLARDVFRYRISRMTPNGMESIEADEESVPVAVRKSVRDEII